jgi:hypothetical protein
LRITPVNPLTVTVAGYALAGVRPVKPGRGLLIFPVLQYSPVEGVVVAQFTVWLKVPLLGPTDAVPEKFAWTRCAPSVGNVAVHMAIPLAFVLTLSPPPPHEMF